MNSIFSLGFQIVLGCLGIAIIIIFIVAIVAQILMICNFNKNGKESILLLFNPFYAQFFGNKYLTEKGIYWRNISWKYFKLLFKILIGMAVFLFLSKLVSY